MGLRFFSKALSVKLAYKLKYRGGYMFRIVKFTERAGGVRSVFLGDLETGNSVKDLMTVPGTYQNVVDSDDKLLSLEKLDGSIGSYLTTCFALTVSDSYTDVEDVTADMSRLLTMPDTAARALMGSMDEEKRDALSEVLDAIHFCESIKQGDKLCLPPTAFSKLGSELTKEMTSVRNSYSLKSTDNQEIFQTNFDTEFGVLLPALGDIHSGNDELISALDILRVTAPYRKQERANVCSYRGIYHTPYYKVDMKLRGMVPNYLAWITGYSVNDMLDISSNERHMANNLNLLICSDLSRYVSEMVSGVFFGTQLGSLLSKLCGRKDPDVIQQLCEDIKEVNNNKASCSLSFSQIDELQKSGWYEGDVVRTIKENLTIADGYLQELLENRPIDRRTIDCDSIPFTLSLTDEQERSFTDLMINNGYISSAMQKFLTDLCKKAYRVNWGHTGATLAIPGFNIVNHIPSIDDMMSTYINDRLSGQPVDFTKYPNLYARSYANPGFTDDDAAGESEDDDEIYSRFDYYITAATAQKIAAGSLSDDYFSAPAPASQTTEEAIVEYYRNVKGENNLDNFISAAFIKTADVSIFIECFIKLMRWGERRPKLLVLQKHPEIRHVFDLNSGLRIDNIAIVDESELIKSNGCEYSLAGMLCTDSSPVLSKELIVGFLLQKDYGTVKKSFLASWVDLGEMVANNAINIGDFAVVTKMSVNKDELIPVESFEKKEYGFYVSDSNIESGLKLKIQPKDLSAMALLTTPGIMNSMGYLRSLKNDTIITTKDRQYDILRRYSSTLLSFYTKCGGTVNNCTNSVEFAACAGEFYELWNQGDTKREANEVNAANTLRQLNLEGPSASSVKWDDSELSGKFMIISDMDMKSTLPPIEFTERPMREIAAKARNRVVLLLLQKEDRFIFCRKDLTAKEVAISSAKDANGRIVNKYSHKNYAFFAQIIDNLTKGVEGKINSKPVVLHRSLQGLI